MNRKQKVLLIIGPMTMSFIYAMTHPVVQIYFMRLVSSDILAIADMVSTGLAAIVNTTVSVDKCIEYYRKHFVWIVLVDIVCFWIVSFLGVEYVEIRFLGFAVLNAVSTTLWVVVMRNAVNRRIKGDKLTAWESYADSWYLYASLTGSIVVLIGGSVSIQTAITLQCLANLLMGLTDIKAYKCLQ